MRFKVANVYYHTKLIEYKKYTYYISNKLTCIYMYVKEIQDGK